MVAEVIDANKVQKRVAEIARERLEPYRSTTTNPDSVIRCLIDAIVEAVNAELESMVERADTQILERAMVHIGEEIARRERVMTSVVVAEGTCRYLDGEGARCATHAVDCDFDGEFRAVWMCPVGKQEPR